MEKQNEEIFEVKDLREDNMIILSKQTLSLLLSQKMPSDLISLYIFYYYTEKWQKTSEIKGSFDDYTAKKLGWKTNKVKKIKCELIKLKII